MQAFHGIRVLDLTHVLAGPFSTYQLAVLGADVIKIESATAFDMNREIGPFEGLNDKLMGSHFQCQAGNKRAITLNLKTEEGRAIFRNLALTADVIVENYRAGAMAGLGLGYEDICAIKPDIIYCSITGFGQTGPKGGHGAFDNVIQAFSGMMAATGYVGGPAIMIGLPLIDYGTGTHAAFAIASALLRRQRTGEGQYLDVAMLDSALMMMCSGVVNTGIDGRPPKRSEAGRDWTAGYGCYATKSGELVVGVFTAAQHARLWRAVGRPDLAAEMAELRIADLVSRRDQDVTILEDIFLRREADDWEAILNEAGVPAARVRTLDEALASSQVESRSVLGPQTPSADGKGSYRPPVAAFRCSTAGPQLRSLPPRLGQHTDEVLASIGYPADVIAELRRKSVI